jgi:hypothetical protein
MYSNAPVYSTVAVCEAILTKGKAHNVKQRETISQQQYRNSRKYLE